MSVFDPSGTRSDRTHDVAVDPDRQAATEDHDRAVKALLDPEKRVPRPVQFVYRLLISMHFSNAHRPAL